MKTRFACLMAISFVALLGFMQTGKGDVFTTDNFSGTLNLSSPLTLPAGAASAAALPSAGIFSLNYVGTDQYDRSGISTNKLQVYNFIPPGSVSLTLFTPFGNFPFSSGSLPSGSSKPTLVVWNKDAVGFDFTMSDTIKSSIGNITLTLNVNAPLTTKGNTAPPINPPVGTSYKGVLEDVTLTATFGSSGTTILSATTTPEFTVVPEPSTMALLGLGAPLVGVALLPRRQRIWS